MFVMIGRQMKSIPVILSLYPVIGMVLQSTDIPELNFFVSIF
jgi:hypothetical protein